MNITINGGNNTIIDLSGVTKFGELRDSLPSTGNRRVPGYKQLRKDKRTSCILKKKTESGEIEIYDNGFFIFEECGRMTVYGVDRCENPETYSYSGQRCQGAEPVDFSMYPWELILESAASARLAHNSDSRGEYLGEISLDAPESENNPTFSVKPEHEVREEEEEMAAWHAKRKTKMLAALEKPTARQREIAMLYFKEHKKQEEIASLLGKSQAYISKTINRYLEIVNENI